MIGCKINIQSETERKEEGQRGEREKLREVPEPNLSDLGPSLD